MMDRVKRILAKNNEGVQCISKGCYDDARQAFKTALLFLKDFYEEHVSQLDPSDALIHKYRCPPLLLEPSSVPNQKSKHLRFGSHYVYQNALLAFVDPNFKIENKRRKKKNSVSLTALITFNLSLAYHFKEDDQSSNQLKSLRLYMRAWNALNTESCASIKEQMCSEVVALGTLNNMGVIFHELGNYEHARSCFTALRHVLLSKTDSVLSLTRDARGGMMMNVLFQEDSTTAVAA